MLCIYMCVKLYSVVRFMTRTSRAQDTEANPYFLQNKSYLSKICIDKLVDQLFTSLHQ